MVTLKEIAETCGVSATTVSNVINGKAKTSEETKNRILQVIKETGYKPNIIAKGLRSKRSRSIAIIAEDLAQFTSPPIIESIMETCEKMDYRVVIHNLRLYDRWQDTWYGRENEYRSVTDPVVKEVLSAQVDGIIYVAGHARIIKTFNKGYDIPVVMCYAYSESKEIPSVVIDDEKGAHDIVSYLIEHGHKRIGFVGGRIDNIHTAQRLMGYQRALFEKGILVDPKLIYYGDWSRESGYDGAKELMKQEVTALFGISDQMTGGIYDFLYENGKKIGKDISVAGFDNESISAFFRPKLTTMELPLRQIGKKSAELLLDRLENTDGDQCESDKPEVIKMPCRMIIRESIAQE
ncbi:LacI family DNA-binding transcriptional regulator [Butyrivibrio sp. YAB3001]|uniref:LacI family DNA-binding transcriptional regulator n=1 Tax=Butyrivibrio sp. YAB3001 TaxID=1520812 RepID=UPI0008F643CE|nr:LacI family DNA-binding transcriptional regulator [Butyrivibrio sp. YAB3001]SFC07548.1 LacI family transcriptional regulator [Butyrivibrio sp. YAB3001]